MKKITLITFLILSFSYSFGQEKFIQLAKNETGKVRLFKENKRVKVKTLDGKKFIGRFLIVNESTISIKGQEISLNNIERIKSRSIVAGIGGTILIILGTYSFGISGIVAVVDVALAKGFAISSLIIASSGIFMNEFVSTHKSSKWSYKIIEK